MKAAEDSWSVVIPLYNKQDFIEATLRSVLVQADNDLELLVVDDGSSDEGPDRVQALGDPRVRLVRQANAGVSAARNRGIREAMGRWIVFLDADDLLHPQALHAYRQLSASYPSACMLGGKDLRVDSTKLKGYEFKPHPDRLPMREIRNLPKVFLTEGLPFSSSSVAIRRDFLLENALGFPEGESMGEDLDLWLRVAERTSLACTSAGLVIYRVGLAQSLMGSYRDLVLLPVWQRLRQRARSAAMPTHLRGASLRLAAEMETTLARRLAGVGRFGDAWQHLFNARAAALGYRWWVTALGLLTRSRSILSR